MAAASPAAPKSRARAKGSEMTKGDKFWRATLRWIARILRYVGVLIIALAVVAYVAGLFVANPIDALTREVEYVWYTLHSFSLDLFQVFIERKVFFWLSNPTDPWFNVVRPILFQTPLALATIGAVLFGFGWGIGRIVRLPQNG